jgi:hypothetical protein
MSQPEPDPHLTRLGLSPDYTQEDLRAAYVARAAEAPAGEQDALRDSHNVLNARIRRRMPRHEADLPPPGYQAPPPAYVPPVQAQSFDLDAYDKPWITAFGPVVTALLALLVVISPLGFFLNGFHTWAHEFGHATVAWLAGHTASPLPIGWTNTGPKTPFVYFGIIFLLVVLAVAGVRERKVWPVLIAVTLLPLQFYLSWMQPEHRYDLWVAFAGIGGEFYLSAAAIALFHVRLPEKFRWGWCRYLFVFLGAGVFAKTFLFWRDIRYGRVPLPFGSMVNGEEDAGGDLNILQDDYGWGDRRIIATYHELGNACLLAVLIVHLFFALGLNRVVGRLWSKGSAGNSDEPTLNV